MTDRLPLKYGNNPHQIDSFYGAPSNILSVLNGSPSYINMLDILHGWQITRDVNLATGRVAAVSMKHNTPVGLAVPGVLDEFSQNLLGVSSLGTTASAYIRARSSDWSAAYGDMIVISGSVDEEFAELLSRLVSDGIAAYEFSSRALEILKRKKNNHFLIVKIDPDYKPASLESRNIFGIQLNQQRNDYLPKKEDFSVISGANFLLDDLWLEIILTTVAMKYTVSNSIVMGCDGRTLSISSGQQSRVLATEIACLKLQRWLRLQSEEILAEVRSSRDRLTDKIAVANTRSRKIVSKPQLATPLLLASDGFIPFVDNILLAAEAGVNVLLEPSGAARAPEIAMEAARHQIALIRTPIRYFYH